MSGQTSKPPTWFWIVGGVSLVWNLLGVMAYIMQVSMSPEALAALPETDRNMIETMPAWATGAFAIAVFAGAVGCVALLLRKGWSESLFILSLVGVLVQNTYSFLMTDLLAVYGPTKAIMPAFVLIVGVFLIWLSRMSKVRGWIA